MKKRVLLVLRVLLIVGYICSLLFTFYQSSLPKDESKAESDAVLEWLEPIIPSDTPVGEYVHTNIREIAHFTEFFIQGIFLSLYLVIFIPTVTSDIKSKLKYIIGSYILSPIIPLLDETLQIFTSRGPQISDVWVDTFGFVSSITIVYLCFFLIFLLVKSRKQKKDNYGKNYDSL